MSGKLILMVVVLAMVPGIASAYFAGRTVKRAELKEDPTPHALTLKVLPQGTEFNAPDTPRNGYYYVRTAKKVGWLEAQDVGRGGGAKKSDPAAASAPPTVQ